MSALWMLTAAAIATILAMRALARRRAAADYKAECARLNGRVVRRG